CACTLAFSYDSDVLTLEKVVPSEEFGGNFAFGERAVWISNGDVKADGVFLTLRFRIGVYVEYKDYSIGVFYNKGDICNYNEEDVDFEVRSGKVTVLKTEEKETAPAVTDVVSYDSGAISEPDDPITDEPAVTERTGTVSEPADSDIDNGDGTEKAEPASTSAAEILGRAEEEIRKAVEYSLEKSGTDSLSSISGDRKEGFVKEVLKELGLSEADLDPDISVGELFDAIAGTISGSDSAAPATDEKGTSGDDTDRVADPEKENDNGNGMIWIIAAVIVVIAAVSIAAAVGYNRSKKSKK
ncbi:MAG: hypothetical protein IJR90_03045, partial [Clostridia bacterium]|nr:hypothetical protein [Clostridia bacterium]